MTDALDAIMAVMEDAFDSQYGEAWTRRQVADSLTLRNVFFTLINADGTTDGEPEKVSGFALTRQVLDEEEILLIAVRPSCRGRARNAARIFLEMRDGNPAEHLYRRFGFEKIGHRRGYYRGAVGGPLDAITFAKDI